MVTMRDPGRPDHRFAIDILETPGNSWIPNISKMSREAGASASESMIIIVKISDRD